MNLLVIGGTRGCGAEAVKDGLARGHRVTAFSRNPGKLAVTHSNLRTVSGDFHDETSVHAVVAGHDAVVLTPGVTTLSTFKERPDFFSRGTAHTIGAMQKHGVKRLVVLSALGVGDSYPLMPPVVRWLVTRWFLKGPYADHEVQEKLVRASGLEWVIARPSGLRNGPANRAYKKTSALEKVPMAISRADVGHFLVDACEKNDWLGSAVHLGG